MEVKEVSVEQKIKYLFNIATSYIGKEIDINKDSYFIIDQICHEDVVGEYNYHICYSLGNNGMIDIYYIYSSNNNSFRIDNIIFYVVSSIGEIAVGILAIVTTWIDPADPMKETNVGESIGSEQ